MFWLTIKTSRLLVISIHGSVIRTAGWGLKYSDVTLLKECHSSDARLTELKEPRGLESESVGDGMQASQRRERNYANTALTANRERRLRVYTRFLSFCQIDFNQAPYVVAILMCIVSRTLISRHVGRVR